MYGLGNAVAAVQPAYMTDQDNADLRAALVAKHTPKTVEAGDEFDAQKALVGMLRGVANVIGIAAGIKILMFMDSSK